MKTEKLINIFKGSRKNKLILILIQAFIVITVFVIAAVYASGEHIAVDMDLSAYDSDYMTFENGWYADEESTSLSEEVEALRSPSLSLGSGYYTLKVDYECSSDQNFTVYDDYTKGDKLEAGTAILSKNLTSETLDFWLEGSTEDFHVSVKYNGKGSLRINNVTLERSHALIGRIGVYLLFLFIILDCFLFAGEIISRNRYKILALAGIVFLCSLPLMQTGLASGHDINFHLARMEGLSKEIMRGVFPVRIQSMWSDGAGYANSIFYGDILLYLPALLRICGFTIMESYKYYIFFMNILTAVLSYVSFKRIFKNEVTSLVTTLVFCLASYRLANMYIRTAAGEFTAMGFLPVVALGLYLIYTEELPDFRTQVKNALILALGMTGLLLTHTLSVEMVGLFLIPLVLILFKRTFTKPVILQCVMAVGMFVLLNLFFLVPFLDYMMNVPVRVTAGDMDISLQNDAVWILQMFAFMQKPYGWSEPDIGNRLALTPGLILMLSFVAGIVLWICRKLDKMTKLFLLFSALALFVVSDLFPWGNAVQLPFIGQILSKIQFPWRILTIAIIFLTLLFGSIFKKMITREIRLPIGPRAVSVAVVSVSAFMLFIFISQYVDDSYIVRLRGTSEFNKYTAVSGGEYLREGSSIEEDQAFQIISDVPTEIISRDGTDMVLNCSTPGETDVTVPIFNYKGYEVRDNAGNLLEISDGDNNFIKFHIPGAYEGEINVRFVSPWYWRVAEVITLLSLIAMIVWLVRCRRGKDIVPDSAS